MYYTVEHANNGLHVVYLCWCVVSRIGLAGTSYVAATVQVPNRDIAL